MKELLRQIPKVDSILADQSFSELCKFYDNSVLVKLIRIELEKLRKEITEGSLNSVPESIIETIANSVREFFKPYTRRAVNGTGVVMNTGLGRAPLSDNAVTRANEVLNGYCTLEVDVKSGKRGRREDKISDLISILTGAEAATVVNNNAAAVMICINTLSNRKEAIISRGELVEIGGSFRMPDIIKKSGAKMVEVGSTNKTKLSDFESAISSKTGAILKVHTSNYRIKGFTEEVTLKDLAALAHEKNIPLYYDLGGGVFNDLSVYGLPHEPTVSDSIKDGADLFSFSGDKVLGGPQCGIIAGKRELVEKVKKNPLMRVLRTDKIRLAALEETLMYFMRRDPVGSGHTTLTLLAEKREVLRKRAEELVQQIKKSVPPTWKISVEDVFDQAGSGAMPTEKLEGCAVAVIPDKIGLNRFSEEMRTISDVPVFGYVDSGKYYISVRTVFLKDQEIILSNLKLISDKYSL
jgi:L-seryl-tRNA(Ser) seleniumtransferase